MILRRLWWTSPEKLKYFFVDVLHLSFRLSFNPETTELTRIFKELEEFDLLESGNYFLHFLDENLFTAQNNVAIEEALELLSADNLASVCKTLKLEHRQGRRTLIDSIINHSRKKNYFGTSIEQAVIKWYVFLKFFASKTLKKCRITPFGEKERFLGKEPFSLMSLLLIHRLWQSMECILVLLKFKRSKYAINRKNFSVRSYIDNFYRVKFSVYTICWAIFTLYSPTSTETSLLIGDPKASLSGLLYQLL